MIIHLIDGTYELFRYFYGHRSYNKGKDKPFGAVAGVLNGVLEMIEKGATHAAAYLASVDPRVYCCHRNHIRIGLSYSRVFRRKKE